MEDVFGRLGEILRPEPKTDDIFELDDYTLLPTKQTKDNE